jgi:hypothetical protein
VIAAKPTDAPRRLWMLAELAFDRALLVREGRMDLHEAVDGLQQIAKQFGLIRQLGQNAVQAVIAAPFAMERAA